MSLRLTRHGAIALITLDRQDVLNALNFEQVARIASAIDDVAAGDARALLITGAGDKAFCAGADIKELGGRTPVEQRRAAQVGQAAFAKLDSLPVPSVAVINGYAFGGGLELALACTFRIARRDAKMGLPEIKLGVFPGYGGTQRLPRLIGEGRALDLILTGRSVGADEALGIGLINRLFDGEALAAGIAFAHEFTGYSLRGLEFARQATMRALDLPIHDGLKVEADLSTLVFQTEDAGEGFQAFLEKRKPAFKDR